MGIHHNLVSSHDYILDKYSEVRRKIWTDVVNPISRENFQRLVAQEANTARENDGFFRVCVLAEGDEGVAGELAMVNFSLSLSLSFFFFFFDVSC